jgi:hypothetical protein
VPCQPLTRTMISACHGADLNRVFEASGLNADNIVKANILFEHAVMTKVADVEDDLITMFVSALVIPFGLEPCLKLARLELRDDPRLVLGGVGFGRAVGC